MTPRNLFRVVVASVGLIVIVLGALGFIESFALLFTMPELGPAGWKAFPVKSLIQMGFGFAILFGYPPFADFAFPFPKETPANATQLSNVAEPEPDPNAPRCVSCQAVIPRGASQCPQCGWTQPKQAS